jgi:high-affinity nickel-transport protein
MISVWSIVALGFLLGMRHATDADHVVAVATIVSRERTMSVAARIGAVWGVGHTLTIVFVGAPIILFNWAVPPRIGLTMELSVGLMLILLGTLNITGVHRTRQAQAPHAHGPGDAAIGWMDRAVGPRKSCHVVRPLLVGIVHGLAGSAAVALLVLTTIRDPIGAIAYLIVFGVGTLAGMVLVTTVIALPFTTAAAGVENTHRRLQLATGLLSLAFGCFIAYKIGIVGGVFGATPHWTPE